MPPRDYAAIAAAWSKAVLDGTALVGLQVKQAVVRHENDLVRAALQCADRSDFPYRFDPEAADKACALAERLAFPKGPKRGQRFRLSDWQVWLLRVFFGWVDTSDLPRWRSAYVELPKGSGKSPLAALIGLIKLARGRAVGAKVYAAATTEKQANNVFEPAQEMLRLSADVREAAGLVVCEHTIRGIGDPRTFERVSAEKRSADGTVGDLYIVDETHQHPNRNLHDVLVQNASKVEGSCILDITTAGTDQSPTAIGWILHQEARDVLAGKLDEPAHLAFISAADRNRDPWDETTWRQANLNYGVSVSPAGFRAAVKSIKADPGGQPHFFATRLGWWQENARGWMDMAAFARCALPELRIEDFADRACVIGVDLAAVGDLTAAVRLFVWLGDDDQRRYAMFVKAWLPEGSKTLTTVPDVKLLADQGHVILTPGAVMDFNIVRDDILADGPFGAEVTYDPWNATQLSTDLMAEGVTTVEVRQGTRTQSEPMKALEAAVISGRFVHDGNPVNAYCFGNVLAVADANDNIRPMRSGEHKKIDVASAAINAMVRASVIKPRTSGVDWIFDTSPRSDE